MPPELSLAVALYIGMRSLDYLTRQDDRESNEAVKVVAALSLIAALMLAVAAIWSAVPR